MISCAVLPLAVMACVADAEDEGEDSMEASELTSKSVRLKTGTTTFKLKQTAAQDLTVTVDCKAPASPEALGPVFELEASALGASASDPARAGYWSWTGHLVAGTHTMKFKNPGESMACTVRTSAVPSDASCRERTVARSTNMDHTHIPVGSESPDWEKLPASGNHWGAWAAWSTSYPKPVKRGFLLHNLEHGGLVFSYKCESDKSASCAAARDALAAIAQEIGPRVLITPDPSQPEMFAIRGWRWAYSSSCLDEASAKQFAHDHYRQGLEDADSDPPIPYDPTSTNVPCENLMNAPDSCSR